MTFASQKLQILPKRLGGGDEGKGATPLHPHLRPTPSPLSTQKHT